MTANAYDNDDLALLASRALDEALSDEDRARLQQAQAGSAELRVLGERFRTVEGWLKQWGGQQPTVDTEPYVATVAAMIQAGGGERGLGHVDESLARWATKQVDTDEERFTAAVMERIGGAARIETRRTGIVRRRVIRLFAPLAAAAVLLFAVIGVLTTRQTADLGKVIVRLGPQSAGVGWGSGRYSERGANKLGKVVVAFARSEGDGSIEERPQATISMISLGASPMPRAGLEPPPL